MRKSYKQREDERRDRIIAKKGIHAYPVMDKSNTGPVDRSWYKKGKA